MTKSKTKTKTAAEVDATTIISTKESALLPVLQKKSSSAPQTVSDVSDSVPADADQKSKDDNYRAAVALNLCMVSLSQIVDYNDINILRMEYEAILNNINLECIPKDDALLNALQSILDTCHFFTLHEKNKELLKKKQALKLKAGLSNINFFVITGGGNPYAAAANLALMIGVAAVNYKTQKAKAEYENEAEEWELEKSALEQLHELRGALFTAAWRLADKYQYPDAWRLSEKQIKLYDEILADPDPFSRFIRLETIKDKFEAYPVFFYYLAHSAIEAAEEEKKKNQQKIAFINTMYQKAEEALNRFDKYYSVARLLREDLVAASAYLDRAEIQYRGGLYYMALDSVKKAQDLAGFDFTILQNCVFQYLRVIKDVNMRQKEKKTKNEEDISNSKLKLNEAKDSAIKCLKILVANDYNVSVNSKILSEIHIKDKNKADYDILDQLVSKRSSFKYRHILPWPRDEEEADKKQMDAQEALRGPGFPVDPVEFFKSDEFTYVIFCYCSRSISIAFSDFKRACQETLRTKDTKSLRDFFDDKEKCDSERMIEKLYQELTAPFIKLCMDENIYKPLYDLYQNSLLQTFEEQRDSISVIIRWVDEKSRKEISKYLKYLNVYGIFTSKESFTEKEYSDNLKKLEEGIQTVFKEMNNLACVMEKIVVSLFRREKWSELLQKPEKELNDIEVRLRLLDFFEEQSELKRKKLLRDIPGYTDLTLEEFLASVKETEQLASPEENNKSS